MRFQCNESQARAQMCLDYLEDIEMNTNYALAFMIVGILSAGQAMAGKPSSDDRDRKNEQRGSSERTQDRQRDAAADEPQSINSNREREQRRHSEYTRESERDRDDRWDGDERRDRDERRDSDERWGSDERQDRDERWGSDERRDSDERRERRGDRRSDDRNKHFGDQHRNTVRDYYSNEFHRGNCPPGLARKQNGCMPPGQAKKWNVGQQLPRNVIFHNLPTELATQLGQPPAGHRYVQVEDDILLITSRTGRIIDAISVLGNQ